MELYMWLKDPNTKLVYLPTFYFINIQLYDIAVATYTLKLRKNTVFNKLQNKKPRSLQEDVIFF